MGGGQGKSEWVSRVRVNGGGGMPVGGDERREARGEAEADGAAPSVALLTSSGDQIKPPDVTFGYKEDEDIPSLGAACCSPEGSGGLLPCLSMF